jgi:hypothetical protein
MQSNCVNEGWLFGERRASRAYQPRGRVLTFGLDRKVDGESGLVRRRGGES